MEKVEYFDVDKFARQFKLLDRITDKPVSKALSIKSFIRRKGTIVSYNSLGHFTKHN